MIYGGFLNYFIVIGNECRQSSFFSLPETMKMIAKIMHTKSARETTMKGAQGAILSNKIPPTKVKVVVPMAAKNVARPERVPLTSLRILRKKIASTARN